MTSIYRGSGVRRRRPLTVRKPLASLAALGLLAAFAPAAHAQPTGSAQGYLSASSLFGKCRGTSVDEVSYCFAYVAGVADTARAYQSWLGAADFCIPVETPQSELITTFEDYFTRHPTLGDAQAGSVVILALENRYGCPEAEAPADVQPATPDSDAADDQGPESVATPSANTEAEDTETAAESNLE